jgi:hypothetical protein
MNIAHVNAIAQIFYNACSEQLIKTMQTIINRVHTGDKQP